MLNNPFEPGSGAVPPIWVGRDDELADITSRLVPRRRAGLFERGRTYLGDPGLGKSVLVNRIAGKVASALERVREVGLLGARVGMTVADQNPKEQTSRAHY